MRRRKSRLQSCSAQQRSEPWPRFYGRGVNRVTPDEQTAQPASDTTGTLVGMPNTHSDDPTGSANLENSQSRGAGNLQRDGPHGGEERCARKQIDTTDLLASLVLRHVRARHSAASHSQPEQDAEVSTRSGCGCVAASDQTNQTSQASGADSNQAALENLLAELAYRQVRQFTLREEDTK
jgi:hypothetical protein